MFDINKLSRQEKIDLLKGIAAGTKSLNDFLPVRVLFFRQRYDEPDRFVRTLDGKVFSLKEYSDFVENAHRTNTFVIHGIDSGYPIATSEDDIDLTKYS